MANRAAPVIGASAASTIGKNAMKVWLYGYLKNIFCRNPEFA